MSKDETTNSKSKPTTEHKSILDDPNVANVTLPVHLAVAMMATPSTGYFVAFEDLAQRFKEADPEEKYLHIEERPEALAKGLVRIWTQKAWKQSYERDQAVKRAAEKRRKEHAINTEITTQFMVHLIQNHKLDVSIASMIAGTVVSGSKELQKETFKQYNFTYIPTSKTRKLE